jgi:hypothetical protein
VICTIGVASSWQAHFWCAFSEGNLQPIVGAVSFGGLIAAWRWRTALPHPGPIPTSEIASWMRNKRRGRVARSLLLALCALLAGMICVQVAIYVTVGDVECGNELSRTARVLLTIWCAGGLIACALALSSRLFGGGTRRAT